jgi:hypothetical protein
VTATGSLDPDAFACAPRLAQEGRFDGFGNAASGATLDEFFRTP